MKSSTYESAVIINAALDDDQIESIITRIKETIVSNGGEIKNIDNWGRKRLAYMVKKSKIGYYAIFRFSASSNIISKLERFYQLDEQILRYLTIKLDNDAIEYLEQKQAVASSNENDNSETADAEENMSTDEVEDDSEEGEK